MMIIRPDYSAPEWECLPGGERARICELLRIFESAPGCGVVAWLRRTAAASGMAYATLARRYYAMRRAGWVWTALLDRRVRGAAAPAAGTRSRQPHFMAYLVGLAERHQRTNRPAIRMLKRQWQAREIPIPGYEDWAGWPAEPAGWHERSLSRLIQEETNRARMAAVRIGTSGTTNRYLPTVLTTRTQLWPLAVIQIDDVWHDNAVTYGKGRELVRVLELGALDLYTAHRYHWGARPRRKKAAGGHEGIGGADMRLFLAGMLHSHGFSPRGTMLMSERATARIDEKIARILYDATGGRVRVDYQPIEGKQAALCGYWSGSEGGNFRAKAALESLHNLMHNDLAALPMQTGSPSSGLAAPVTTARQEAYISRVLRDVAMTCPQRLDMLELPTWDFHRDFLPFLTDYYHFGLASRTDHELEGWAELGRIITEWTLAPGSGCYLSDTDFLALPEPSRMAIRGAARQDPAGWSRQRNLSPLECWQGRPKSEAIPITVLCDILGQDLAREVKAARGFLEFADVEIAPDPLIYMARYSAGPMRGREIQHGEKISLFVLPFDDATAICVDSHGRYLGEVPLYRRVTPVDAAAFHTAAPWEARPEVRSRELRDAAGVKHSRIADILTPSRHLHGGEVEAARDLRTHNSAVLAGRAVTPEEQAEARSAAGAQAARTAAANRLQARGTAMDYDDPAPAAGDARAPWETLGGDDDVPEAFC